MNILKDHIKLIAAVIISLTTIIGTANAIDSRYLKVSDYNSYQIQSEIRRLEDEVFKLDFKVHKGDATPLDKAMLDRLESRLNELRGLRREAR